MPPVIKSLLKNDDPESKEFRTNIRDYNNALSFSSNFLVQVAFLAVEQFL